MSGKIKDVGISSDRIEAGNRMTTSLHFDGELCNGFFDNIIINERNVIVDWNSDPWSYDPSRKSGRLQGSVKVEAKWHYHFPEWLLPGKYVVSVRVYDDPNGTRKSRKLIDRIDLDIQVTKSTSDNMKLLYLVYRRLLNRSPDQQGLRFWYENMQHHGVTKAWVVETGFAKSREFKLRQFYKFMTLGEAITEKEYKKWEKLLCGLFENETNNFDRFFSQKGGKARKLSNAEYVESIIGLLENIDSASHQFLSQLEAKKITKAKLTMEIVENNRLLKLIIFNNFFASVVSSVELESELQHYLDGIKSFENLWTKFNRQLP